MTAAKYPVFLPTTTFPMRADLPVREPGLLARWDRIDLWPRTRAAAQGRPPFVLHDGPIYSNGNLAYWPRAEPHPQGCHHARPPHGG